VTRGHVALIGIGLLILAVVLRTAIQPTSAPLLPHGTLRVGVDPSYPPFAFYEGQQPRGFEIDLAGLLADSMDVPIQLVGLGFDGLYDAIKVDRVDLVIAALSPDPLRTADVRYSRPYFDNGLLLVSRPETQIESMHNLSGSALAYAFGSAADAEARRWLRRIQPFATLPYETPAIALDAVRIGTAQSALVEAVDLAVYAAVHPEWQPTSAFVTHAPFVIAIGADRGELAQVIDRLLRDMEADGRLESLRHRWF
jgi:polar amino acid transport system substrate-binding protein